MKNTYIILFIFSLLLTGCSSTYTIKGYPSKDRYYRDFNRSVGDKDLKIILSNDSLYETTGGGVIKYDTLFTPLNVFPVEIIKTINYTNTLKSEIFGFLIGEIVTGILLAPILVNNISASNFASALSYYSFASLSGCVFGGIAGFYIGWDVTYQFN
jgi:hypothetical protein